MRRECSLQTKFVSIKPCYADRGSRAMGMRPVVVDSCEQKEALATKIGAEAFIDFKKESDVPAKVREVSDGIGAHGVLVSAWQTYKGTNDEPPLILLVLTSSDTIGYTGGRIGAKIM